MGSGSLMAHDKWTAWPQVTNKRFLAMHASQMPGVELETSCNNLSTNEQGEERHVIWLSPGCTDISGRRSLRAMSHVGGGRRTKISAVIHQLMEGWRMRWLIQLPRCIGLARIGFLIPSAVRITNAAQAIIVASVAHYHVHLTDSVIGWDVNRFVLNWDNQTSIEMSRTC